jgi:hypothetical protein
MTMPEHAVLSDPLVNGHQSGAASPINVLMVTDHLGYAGGIIHGATRYYEQVLPRLERRRINMRLCILGDEHPFAETLEEVLSNLVVDGPASVSASLQLTERCDLVHQGLPPSLRSDGRGARSV